MTPGQLVLLGRAATRADRASQPGADSLLEQTKAFEEARAARERAAS